MKEAKEYAKPWKNSLVYVSIKDAYLAGAEPREKRIADLEAEKKDLTLKIDRLESAKDFYSRPSMFEEPIKCAECGNPIYLSEKEIKERCLYQTSDWTKCLCPSCTDEWKKSNFRR